MHKDVRQIKLPNQEIIEPKERVSLLAIWALHFDAHRERIIHAGLGKPTYPMSEKIPDFLEKKKKELTTKFKKCKTLVQSLKKAKSQSEYNKIEKQIIHLNLVVDYGHPQGDIQARHKIAHKVSHWYHQEVTAEDILFTTGGVAGLYCIFEYLNQSFPKSVVLTPFPYYPLYGQGNLFPIDVLQEPGYHLTANAVKKSIGAAQQQGKQISAFVFCDPNNPLGTVVSPKEWRLIMRELNKVPQALIILDEAYAEICFTHDYQSLFTLANTSLRKRIILLRSATKGCSTSGERMSILITQNKEVMKALLENNIMISLHPEHMSQQLYAEIFPQRNTPQLMQMKNFYKNQVLYVHQRLKDIQAVLPDKNHHPEGSFYAIADLKKLIGMELSKQDQKLLKLIFVDVPNTITTDEYLAYWLMVKYHIMLCPLSYFGLDPALGWLRITCSVGHIDLEKIITVLDECLKNN